MLTVEIPVSSFVRRQRGAVLVTSMLLLLVLTIVGVTVMQMSRMQERMAGNTRDINLAFQGAEGALRSGEDLVRAQVKEPLICTSGTCEIWSKDAIDQVENQDETWWDAKAHEFGTAGKSDMPELAADPLFVVEELGFVRTDGGVEEGLERAPARHFYLVSARSTGGSGSANVLLQSTFARKY